MATGAQTPNLYSLSGWGTQITYSTSSINGQPLLNYDGQGQTRSFRGEQLTVTDTPNGLLVTVLLEIFPDVRNKILGLLVPIVNLPEGKSQIPIQTLALITTRRVALGAPRLYRGQAETFEALKLEGTASIVDF